MSLDYCLVFPSLRLVYNYIPKNMCTTLKRVFLRLEGANSGSLLGEDLHLYANKFSPWVQNLAIHDINTIETRLVVTRNPYDRFLSAFLDKLLFPVCTGIQLEPFVISMLQELGLELGSLSAASLACKISSSLASHEINDHFIPQRFLIPLDSYTHVLRLEDIREARRIEICGRSIDLESENTNPILDSDEHLARGSSRPNTYLGEISPATLMTANILQLAEFVRDGVHSVKRFSSMTIQEQQSIADYLGILLSEDIGFISSIAQA